MDTYKKAFEQLDVPHDMLDRVMRQAESAKQPSPPCKRRRFQPAMAAAACFLLLLCGTLAFHPWSPQPLPTDPVTVGNPIQAVDSIAGLAEALPFPLKTPIQFPDGYSFSHASSINGTLAQIIYTKGDDRITYRMAMGEADISGDYNQYEKTETLDGVTLKGNSNGISLALWGDGTYSYSISTTVPLTSEAMLAICGSITAPS